MDHQVAHSLPLLSFASSSIPLLGSNFLQSGSVTLSPMVRTIVFRRAATSPAVHTDVFRRNATTSILAAQQLPPPASTFPPYEKPSFFKYEIVHQSKKSAARVGRITTPHGSFMTPSFVAVATNAALKCIDHRPISDSLPLVFCNTYHLLLHPGPETVEKAGGLHKFMKRDRPIITDSGGFQVFSLAHGSVEEELNMKRNRKSKGKSLLLKVDDEGATFRSYRDGSVMTLTPESSVAAQKSFGADIIIPLDQLPPYHIDRSELARSVVRSHCWEARSLRAHLSDVRQQAMYCVLHGGIDTELRQQSIDYLTSLPFDGIGIGGALGKNREELIELLRFVMPRLPRDKPNHLLGIADIESIAGAVPLGVDTFDSCFPTRLGRHGTLLSERYGRIQIKQKKWKNVFETPNEDDEVLTKLNVLFMAKYMERIRNSIMNDEI